MHYDVSYRGDTNDHRALLDLCQWLGFRRSLVAFRTARQIGQLTDATARNHALNALNIGIAIAGVEGEPVRRLFARYVGEDGLQEWIRS